MKFLHALTLVSALLISKVLADGICDSFRITSPVENNLHWTAGQCYQVSYDVAGLGDALHDKISVDVYDTVSNAKVSNVVNEEQLNSFGGTNPFNLNVNTTDAGTASYYYMVTLLRDGVACEPKRTVAFEITVNPYSPPSDCLSL